MKYFVNLSVFIIPLMYNPCSNITSCCPSTAIFILDLIEWIISAGSILKKIFSIPTVITSFTVIVLLGSLNKSLFSFTFAELDHTNINKVEVRNSLFEAQSAFYTKVTDVIKSGTLLPYVATLFKSLMAVLKTS